MHGLEPTTGAASETGNAFAQKTATAEEASNVMVTAGANPLGSISLALNVVIILGIAMIVVTVWTRKSKYKGGTRTTRPTGDLEIRVSHRGRS